LAPYAAGCAVMFDPSKAVAALRYYKSLKDSKGQPLMWRDPKAGGYGFQDSVNLGKMWVAKDCVAIDQGPLVLAIENARSGRAWGVVRRASGGARGFQATRLDPQPLNAQTPHHEPADL